MYAHGLSATTLLNAMFYSIIFSLLKTCKLQTDSIYLMKYVSYEDKKMKLRLRLIFFIFSAKNKYQENACEY